MENLDIAEIVQTYVIPWGIKLVLALAIFYIGRMVVAAVVGFVRKLLSGRGMDEILVGFVSAILRWVLLLFVVIAALSQLGINTNSLVALLGAAGLAIGLSLQGSLSNLAAGVMLIIFRPFTKGDFVEAGGATGVIDNISIFTTTMTTPDNKEVIVPNGAIIGSNITNYSAGHPSRRHGIWLLLRRRCSQGQTDTGGDYRSGRSRVERSRPGGCSKRTGRLEHQFPGSALG